MRMHIHIQIHSFTCPASFCFHMRPALVVPTRAHVCRGSTTRHLCLPLPPTPHTTQRPASSTTTFPAQEIRVLYQEGSSRLHLPRTLKTSRRESNAEQENNLKYIRKQLKKERELWERVFLDPSVLSIILRLFRFLFEVLRLLLSLVSVVVLILLL